MRAFLSSDQLGVWTPVPVSGREAELNEASSIGFSGGGESLLSVLQFKVLYGRLATVVCRHRFWALVGTLDQFWETLFRRDTELIKNNIDWYVGRREVVNQSSRSSIDWSIGRPCYVSARKQLRVVFR